MLAIESMPAPRTETVTSITEYAELAKGLITSPRMTLWFRGVGDASYKLVPGLYRHPTISEAVKLIELEFEILNRFKHRSIPFQTRQLTSDWEYLFFMQHYRIPTRLLDWSENAFIALYFAILAAEEKFNRVTNSFTTDAAVWILDPQCWNGSALGAAWRNRILAIPDPPLDSYKPSGDLRTFQTKPVAMAGLHNSARIVAQRGAFTIFGSDVKPMEQIFEEATFPPNALIKVVLPCAALGSLQNNLIEMGYTDSMIYPDLEGLAKEIKRHFSFTN